MCTQGGGVHQYKNEPCPDIEVDEDAAERVGECFLVIAGSNYDWPECTKTGWGPIDQLKSAKFIELVGQKSNVAGIAPLYQKEMTKDNVLGAIAENGNFCQDGDTFVFYYAGHGEQVEDEDGDEEDGKDQCLCTINPETLTPEPRDASNWLIDDDLVEAITSSVPPEANILVIADCCHSGGILDKGSEKWNGFKVVCISGSLSSEVSKGLGKGSFLSRSLAAAYQDLQAENREAYMVSEVYNLLLKNFKEKYFKQSQQTLVLTEIGIKATEMPWPFVPDIMISNPDHPDGIGGIKYDHADTDPTSELQAGRNPEDELKGLGGR